MKNRAIKQMVLSFALFFMLIGCGGDGKNGAASDENLLSQSIAPIPIDPVDPVDPVVPIDPIDPVDPDEPVVNVALTGYGFDPPEISVNPDSLSADLNSGDIEIQALPCNSHQRNSHNFIKMVLLS